MIGKTKNEKPIRDSGHYLLKWGFILCSADTTCQQNRYFISPSWSNCGRKHAFSWDNQRCAKGPLSKKSINYSTKNWQTLKLAGSSFGYPQSQRKSCSPSMKESLTSASDRNRFIWRQSWRIWRIYPCRFFDLKSAATHLLKNFDLSVSAIRELTRMHRICIPSDLIVTQ